MFYSLTIMTLLATILFYSFYPRNDGIKTQDIPDAKARATEMLAHHMAAVEAARVVSYDAATGRNKMAYETWPSGSGYKVPFGEYSAYLPSDFVNNLNFGHEDDDGVPALYCFSNSDGSLTPSCGGRSANVSGGVLGTSDYIITFMTTTPGTLDARALGEKVFLTNYSSDEHLKTMCGIVDEAAEAGQPDEDYDGSGTCIVNNTRYAAVSLPRNFVCTGGGAPTGQLVCITQLSAAYEGATKIHPRQE